MPEDVYVLYFEGGTLAAWSANGTRTDASCAVEVAERQECGFSGIARSACVKRGCCWAVKTNVS